MPKLTGRCRIKPVDESNLSYIDRLGLAYCRLNCHQWDSLFGPAPEGFDVAPDLPEMRSIFKKAIKSKSDFVRPIMNAIRTIIGDANTSRCWWIFVLEETEEDWMRWYVSERVTKFVKKHR